MRCDHCANDNAPASRFCSNCGHKLSAACTSCGRALLTGARFCGWCGASSPAPHQVIEPHGERKQATVLFADIVGSTEMIAGLDAESAIERLQPVVAAMAQVVQRFDGVVLRTLGDGLKAAFGAPDAREGHALLACRAALAMQEAMAALAYPTSIRIGLHSGEVVTGALDTGASVQPEAQGMTVHIASRVEQAAEAGGICISEECHALVSAYCDTVSAGTRVMKGLAAPMQVFRLIGLRPAVASNQFRDGALARLYGREQELRVLKQALLQADQGVASVIGIAASAGVGKSRLCYEFSEWCRKRQVGVLEARALVYGQATPLLPILEMMRAFYRLTPGMNPAEAREKIEARLAAAGPSFADDLPLLADFLGVAEPQPGPPRVDPKAKHVRLRDHFRRMVKASGQQTSVIIVEDLHWLDAPSQDFIETIVDAVSDTKIVLVLNYRPDWRCPWAALPHYRQLSLAELDTKQTDRLVRDLVGDDPALDRMTEHVVRQCGGNPFFAEELIRALAQDGVLIGERGDYHLAASGWHAPVLPATVEAVIGARLDRLAEHDKAVLQIGAVIGKDFSLALVRTVASMTEPDATHLLGRLCDLDLIQSSTTVNGTGYTFRHPLIRDVAYAMQLRTRRTRLHAAVAKALESLAWGGLDEAASMLAHHYEAAGQPVEAAMHLRRAALWVGRTNSAQALADWKKISRLLRDAPRNTANDQLRAFASGRALSYGWREGMTAEEAKPYAEEALQFAREAGDHKHLAVLMGSYGRILAASSAADDYISLVREGLILADAGSDPCGRLALRAMLSQAYFFAGLLREGLVANDAATAAIEAQDGPHDGVVLGLTASQFLGFDVPQWILCLRVRVLVLLGHFEAAEPSLARALQVDPDNIYPVVQVAAHMGAIDLAWHRGDALSARRHADQLATYADQSGMPYLLVLALCAKGLAASADRVFDLAADHFHEALKTARQCRAGLEYEAKLLAFLADTHDRAEDLALAANVAAEAIEVAQRRTDRIAELHARIVAAHALFTCNDSKRRAEAIAHLGRAEYLFNITGAEIYKPLLARAAAGAATSRMNENRSFR